MKIDKEDFEQWRSGVMAEALFKAIDAWAEDAKAAWVNASWDGGTADPILLAALKERYNAFRDLAKVTHIEIEEKLNEQRS